MAIEYVMQIFFIGSSGEWEGGLSYHCRQRDQDTAAAEAQKYHQGHSFFQPLLIPIPIYDIQWSYNFNFNLTSFQLREIVTDKQEAIDFRWV